MKRVATWALVLVVAVVGGSLAMNIGFIRDLYDSLFHHKTFVATGDVVLKRLQEQKRLDSASGTFQVPVVVCNGNPKSYDLKGKVDSEKRTPAQQLLEACGGLLDSKATILASADVEAYIDLSKLTAADITVAGDKVSVQLPPIELDKPVVDAATDLAVVAKDGSVPIVGGKLPDDYQARAARAAEDAIAKVADDSGLPDMGRRSAQSLFEGLLSGLGFAQVDVTVAPTPAEAG